ncbi:hypothetical protein DVH24_005189 [Malus domestica]|uniref:ubiquitinyl hydrolase 1 n=1 Tax=Malus domestica TaxID=3750 RepID=A0A498IGM4_MALDO|nr:hypothetical protein DVH24_005189 [Malus domestica]
MVFGVVGVAQVEQTNAFEDPQKMKFTWTIENFTRLDNKNHYSDIFVVGGFKWRIIMFPKGNQVDALSMYLDAADSGTLPYGWRRFAHFSLAVVNQIDTKYSVEKDTQHQFNARESDWGFTSFMPLGDLYDPSRGYLVSDTVVVEAKVSVRKVLNYQSYDSKKETGYVGLENQRQSGYMNSLLQTFYHIPYFRKAVHHMPTTENDMPSGSIPLTLQRLFYKLQYSDSIVETKELTESFGWDTHYLFMKHDVHEFNKFLSQKLEDKMKGTVVEGTIQQLFEGHYMNYTDCINVHYKSERKESFYDLQLDVKGCRDVYDSFDNYVTVQHLEGDNKYRAEQYGLQVAKKGVLFIDFPPVLQLQLKRFEYDFVRDTVVKVNDRYEFPLQLDLDRVNGMYLSPESDRSVRNLYTLHSVLVHIGGAHDGRYCAFIRPTLSDQWYKFDNERVTKEDVKRALEEQYGGEKELPGTNSRFNRTSFSLTKYSNAYMLVYIRDSDKEKIMCNVDEKDIAEHLRIRLKKGQEKKEVERCNAQAHLYTTIKVSRDKDLAEQIGRDVYFGLVDHNKVHRFRILNLTPFYLFKVGQLRDGSNTKQNGELKLFLEVEFGPDLCLIPAPAKTKKDILVFFKLYEPEKQELRFVGRLFVKSCSRPEEILAKLNQLAGFSPDEEIELYPEIRSELCIMWQQLDKKIPFRFSQIQDGDIICFQKSTPHGSEVYKYPNVPSFFKYLHYRQIVHFRSLEKPNEDDFSLELSKLNTYDDVVENLACRIGLENPTKIRLTAHNCLSQQPRRRPIKYQGAEHLTEMLTHYNQSSDILYYEVLGIPLPELEGLKTLKFAFHHATKDEMVIHTISFPKWKTVGDLINVLQTKVELSHPNVELRVLGILYHKIYKIPEEEKNLGQRDRLIHVYHFTKVTVLKDMHVQTFGEPFVLVIHEGEGLAEVKTRIQKKLRVPDEEFSKWNFAFLSRGHPDYLQDSDIVFSRFQRYESLLPWEQYLGLEHSDKVPKRAYAVTEASAAVPSKRRKEGRKGGQVPYPVPISTDVVPAITGSSQPQGPAGNAGKVGEIPALNLSLPTTEPGKANSSGMKGNEVSGKTILLMD